MELNDKLIVIHQPDLLPYLGFFHRLLLADVYVVLNTVQYAKSGGWMNRDKIKTPNGEKWFTAAVEKNSLGTRICDVLLSESVDWRKKNISQFRENYKGAPHFADIFPEVEALYSLQYKRLQDFNLASIRMLMRMFDIKTDIIMADSLHVAGKSNELVANIVQSLGAHRYLSGMGACDYFDPTVFRERGIEVIWQDFNHPVYPQLYGEFIPSLSSIDLLFNCGIIKSRSILRGCLK